MSQTPGTGRMWRMTRSSGGPLSAVVHLGGRQPVLRFAYRAARPRAGSISCSPEPLPRGVSLGAYLVLGRRALCSWDHPDTWNGPRGVAGAALRSRNVHGVRRAALGRPGASAR